MAQEFLWTEKYRPKKIEDTVLPSNIKDIFTNFVTQKNIPNLILSGPPGTGKTTVAKAMLEELGCDYIVINGSLQGNIDTLRYDIMNFASSVSFEGGRKYVILDEADYLNPNSTQPALRNFMEEYSRNCGFILTCNFKNRIIEPLHSRCTVIDFIIPKTEAAKLASTFFKKVCKILELENIKYEQSVIAKVIQKRFPDWRKAINELQTYSSTGKIDEGIFKNIKEDLLIDLINLMKDKNYTSMRNWVSQNLDTDVHVLYRQFYDIASNYFVKESIPYLVILIAKYQYQNAFAANPEINFMAFLTEVMVECNFL